MAMSYSAAAALDHWCQPLIAKVRDLSVLSPPKALPGCDCTPTALMLAMPFVWSLSEMPHE